MKPDTMKPETILGIETSCDETAVAVVRGGRDILSSVVSSQVELHSGFGGVVPEVASRAHLELLPLVLEQAVSGSQTTPSSAPRIEAVAATAGPGLIGALLVGVSAAKALALAWDVPYVGVNHLEAHLYATFLDEPDIQLPMVVLLVSGGHTMLILMKGHSQYEILGETLDDAAGEAFDKTARALGLGYPGGPLIDRLAGEGDPAAVAFPRPMLDARGRDGDRAGNLDFSFSGLKTAVVNHLRQQEAGSARQQGLIQKPELTQQQVADIAASFQAAVVDVLEAKTMAALKMSGAKAISLAGGVSANSELRSRLNVAAEKAGVPCYMASREMCTDNAAMVAAAAWHQLQREGPASFSSFMVPADWMPEAAIFTASFGRAGSSSMAFPGCSSKVFRLRWLTIMHKGGRTKGESAAATAS